MQLLNVIFLLITLNLVWCYDILVFFPFPGKSHAILGHGYVRHLTKAGHNVTYVTPIPMKNPPKNLRIIDISSNLESDGALKKILNIKSLIDNGEIFNDRRLTFEMIHQSTLKAIKHENVQNMLMDPSEKFDVVIVEWLVSELYAGIAAVFECPYIWSSSLEPHAQILRLIGHIPNPAYAPDFNTKIVPPLSFTLRAYELYMLIYMNYLRWDMHDKYVKGYEEAYGPIFKKKGRELPNYDDVIYNASLILGNSYVAQGISIPLPENYKAIAGYHIEDDVIPLPKNLQEIFDNAKHGVIYFSLGTMMEGKTMPDELKQGLLKTFSKFKQTVVWKLEIQLPDLPSNVHIVHWAPQQSILAHPNTVLFITHGGLLSLIETTYFGVPVIAVPLFGDQPLNANRMVSKGVCIKVDIGYDMPEKFEVAIREILENPRYREKIEDLSSIFKKRPRPPGQELVYWVEHVVETKGARYLRSVELTVPLYQKLFLDLFAVIIICLISIYYLAKYLVKLLNSKLGLNDKKKIS